MASITRFLKSVARPLFLIFSALTAIALCAHAQAGERTITHIVRPGDTLQTISQRYYGTTRRWNDIYRANRDVLRTPQNVETGMKLRLRVPKNGTLAENSAHSGRLRRPAQVRVESLDHEPVVAPAGRVAPARAVTSKPAEEVVRSAPTRGTQSSAPAITSSIELRVRAGDTLESLAEEHLGSAKFWPRIIELNRKLLHGPDDLKPGMLIQIEDLLPHPLGETAPAAKSSDHFSAIEVAASEPHVETVEPPAAIAVPQPSRGEGLPHYDDFIDP